MLKKTYLRKGKNQLIGSITSGYSDTSALIRDEHEQILGRTSQRLNTIRDAQGTWFQSILLTPVC